MDWFALHVQPAFKVILFFLLWFVWAPKYLIPGRNRQSGFEQFFIRLIYGVFFTIVTVYILSPLRLMESFSLIGIFIFVTTFKGCRSKQDINKKITGIFSWLAGNLFDWLDYGVKLKLLLQIVYDRILNRLYKIILRLNTI